MAQLQASTVAGTLTTTGNVGVGIESTTLGGNYSQKLNFATHHYGVFAGVRMTLDEQGNLGIGITNPVGKLDVRAGSGGRIIFGSYDANYYAAFEGGDQLNFYNGASNTVAYINYNGPSAVLLGRNLYVEGNSSGGTTGAVRIKSDGNVGIGTASPTYLLETKHMGIASSNAYFGTGTVRIGGNADAGSNQVLSIAPGIVGIDAPGIVNGRFIINGSGNVGIGTATPTLNTSGKVLHIAASSNEASIIHFTNGTTGNSATDGLIVGRWSDGVNYMYTYENEDLQFGAGNAIRMAITSGGNVGIGTNNPTTHSGGNALVIRGQSGTGSGRAIMELHETGGGKAVFQQVSSTTYIGNLAGNGSLVLLTNGTGTSATEAVLINASGNVGIGTATPQVALHIGGGSISTANAGTPSVYATNGVNVQDGSRISLSSTFYVHAYLQWDQSNFGTESAFGIYGYYGHHFQTRNGSALVIRGDSNNVGIGTATPTEKLSVEGGSIKLNYGNASANYYLLLNKKTGQDGGILFQRDNGNDWQQTNVTNGDLNFYSYGISNFAVVFQRSTGYVGIGTDNPRYPVVIWNRGPDGLADRSLAIGNTAINGTFMYLGTSATTGGYGIIQHISAENVSYGNLVLQPEAANVGIGNTNPARKLDVLEGNVQIVANFQNTNTTSARIKFTDANTGAENVNIGATGTSLAMWTNNTVRMTILSGGNVGIGTVTPTQRLQVEGAIVGGAAGSSGTPNLTGVTTQLAFEARTTTAGNEPSIAYHREGDYTFYLQGQETPRGLRLYGPSNEATPSLFVAGNVGIGTTAPTHKLDVRGSLRVDSSTSFTTEYGAVPNAIIGNTQDEKCLGTPDEWLAINVSGTDYAVPLFSLG
jgi:hypothetical protein